MTAGEKIEPRPHWWRASAVTTAPTLSQVPRVFSCASFSANRAEVKSSLERKIMIVSELIFFILGCCLVKAAGKKSH